MIQERDSSIYLRSKILQNKMTSKNIGHIGRTIKTINRE